MEKKKETEKLMDLLLEETLGGQIAPDLSDRVYHRIDHHKLVDQLLEEAIGGLEIPDAYPQITAWLNREKTTDVFLKETVGREKVPDLSRRIFKRINFISARRAAKRWIFTAAAAAAVLMIAFFTYSHMNIEEFSRTETPVNDIGPIEETGFVETTLIEAVTEVQVSTIAVTEDLESVATIEKDEVPEDPAIFTIVLDEVKSEEETEIVLKSSDMPRIASTDETGIEGPVKSIFVIISAKTEEETEEDKDSAAAAGEEISKSGGSETNTGKSNNGKQLGKSRTRTKRSHPSKKPRKPRKPKKPKKK